MTLNYPGPFELRLFYTCTSFIHVLRLSMEVVGTPSIGSSFADIDVNPRVDPAYPLSTFTDNLVNLLAVRFSSASTTFDYAELWEYPFKSNDATYVASYAIGVAGASGSAQVTANYEMYTFRTEEGGTMRLTLLETIDTNNFQLAYAVAGAGQKAIMDYIVGDASPVVGRDTGRVIVPVKVSIGQNEAVWRKRYRF